MVVRWGVCSFSTLQALNVRYIVVQDHGNRVVPCTNGSAPVRSPLKLKPHSPHGLQVHHQPDQTCSNKPTRRFA